MSAVGDAICPQLSSVVVVPRRIRLDPREREARGEVTAKTVAVAPNMQQLGAATKESLLQLQSMPREATIPVPVPLVPYYGYVEHRGGAKGELSADHGADEIEHVPIYVKCLGARCAWWDRAAEQCSVLSANVGR